MSIGEKQVEDDHDEPSREAATLWESHCRGEGRDEERDCWRLLDRDGDCSVGMREDQRRQGVKWCYSCSRTRIKSRRRGRRRRRTDSCGERRTLLLETQNTFKVISFGLDHSHGHPTLSSTIIGCHRSAVQCSAVQCFSTDAFQETLKSHLCYEQKRSNILLDFFHCFHTLLHRSQHSA